MRKYRRYSDQDVINAAKDVKSIAGLLRKLDLREAGGNYANIQRIIQRLNIDTSHWTKQGWNAGKRLKDWSDYSRGRFLKKHIIKDRGHKCEICLLELWNSLLIPLEIHHIDGDRTNNVLDNLQLLCCNCHAQTDSYRGRKNKISAR